MKKLAALCRRFHQGYTAFVEKQGFFVVLALCVGVIVATALWSRSDAAPPAAPTSPVDEQAAQAGRMEQERLADVATPSPSPTRAAMLFSPPLAQVRVITGFDAARLRQIGEDGLWMLHDACDLEASLGAKVLAMAAGVVVSADTGSSLLGQVTIQHGEDIVAQYAGLAALSAVQPGDPVSAGQTLGFVGKGPLAEQSEGPHLHLRVTRKGRAVDPTLLWKK